MWFYYRKKSSDNNKKVPDVDFRNFAQSSHSLFKKISKIFDLIRFKLDTLIGYKCCTSVQLLY